MSDTGTPQGRRPGARSRVRREPASAPSAGASEPLADSSGNTPGGSPSEGGAVEPDASENAFWLASAGYQLAQMRQAGEQQRAQVLDEARRERPDLTDTQFGILTDQGFPFTIPFEATPEQVLAYLEAFGPPPAPSAAAQGAAERQRSEVLDAARHQRPDLTDAQFAILTDRGFPLTVPFAATVDEVLAYLETFGPPPAPSAAAQGAAEGHRSEVLQEARHQRPDLTDGESAVLTDHEFPLAVPFAATVEEVLAYLDAARPRQRRRRSPSGSAGRPRLQEPDLRRELVRLLAELRDEGEDRPTRELLAERLGIDPGTLRRRLQRFPELRTLLPTSGRPRRIDRA